MPNAVETVFYQILANVSNNGLDDVADWPNSPFDEGDHDHIDVPPDSDVVELIPISDELVAERLGILMGGSWPSVEPSDAELIEGGIRVRGIEALAFYKSKRFETRRPFPGKWGIFYLKQGKCARKPSSNLTE